jgi:hypothetical protein
VEPTKSARLDQLPADGRLRCRVGWRRLRLGVGHASTVRPDPSTLGAVGERGSRRESCLQLVPGSAVRRAPGTRRWRRRSAWSSATAGLRGQRPRPRGPGAAAHLGRSRPAGPAAPPRSCPPSSSQRSTSLARSRAPSSSERSTSNRSATSASVRSSGTCSAMLCPVLISCQAVSQRVQQVVTGPCWSRPVASSGCLVPGPGYPSGGGGRLGRNEPRQSRP